MKRGLTLIRNIRDSRPMRKFLTGLTLIEVLIALVVLTVGVVGLITSFRTSDKYLRSTGNIFSAVRLLQEKIEELKSEGYADLIGDTDFCSIQGNNATRTWIIDTVDDLADNTPPDSDPDDYKRITVSISWNEYGRTLQKSLVTYRTK